VEELTERSGGVKFPNSESTPKIELISKIPPPWKRWSHFALMSNTPAAVFGLAGMTILGFIGLLVALEWCISGVYIGCVSGVYSGRDIPGTIDCIGEIHGCRDIPVGP